MMKLAVGVALVVSTASLVLAVVALREARDDGETSPEALGLGIGLDGFMTRRQVVMQLGLPDRVFRRNPRAECWAYEGGLYEVRMCFGPKRRLAWHAHNIPPDESLLEKMLQVRTTEN
jgi:hypothetical protein